MKLDITKPGDAESAVKAALDKFGRIDGEATDYEPYRSNERNPRRPAGYAEAAFGADNHDFINCGPDRF